MEVSRLLAVAEEAVGGGEVALVLVEVEVGVEVVVDAKQGASVVCLEVV